MKIAAVRTGVVSIPLREPTAFAKTVVTAREYVIVWIEEPVMPDNVLASARIASATDVPVATGEIEATRWDFRHLVEAGAAAILQADATVAGGITEWKRIADMAATWDLPMAPHWMANIHVPLVAAVPNGLTVEYFDPDEDVFNFERIVARPLEPSNGLIQASERAGHGVELDNAAIREFAVD